MRGRYWTCVIVTVFGLKLVPLDINCHVLLRVFNRRFNGWGEKTAMKKCWKYFRKVDLTA